MFRATRLFHLPHPSFPLLRSPAPFHLLPPWYLVTEPPVWGSGVLSPENFEMQYTVILMQFVNKLVTASAAIATPAV